MMKNSKKFGAMYKELFTEFKRVQNSDAHLATKMGFLRGLNRVELAVYNLKGLHRTTFADLYEYLVFEAKKAEDAYAGARVANQYSLKGSMDALALAKKLAFKAAAESLMLAEST